MQPCSPRASENIPNQWLQTGQTDSVEKKHSMQADDKSITANVI